MSWSPTVSWFPKNVARNFHVNLSNFELASLELQRFQALLKVQAIELRATFRGSVRPGPGDPMVPMILQQCHGPPTRSWFPKNVARNFHVNLSNFELTSLELQRF